MTPFEMDDFKRLREIVLSLTDENKRLLAALEPFQRNVEAVSLSDALGHIGREELWNASVKHIVSEKDLRSPEQKKAPSRSRGQVWEETPTRVGRSAVGFRPTSNAG